MSASLAERVAALPVQGERGIYRLCKAMGIGGPECSAILGRDVADYTKAGKAELVRCIVHTATRGPDADGVDAQRDLLERWLADGPPPLSGTAPPRPSGEDPAMLLQHALHLIARQTAGAVDETAVRRIVQEALAEHRPAAVRIEVLTPDNVVKDVGVQHRLFPDLLRYCQTVVGGSRLNIWLAGPPGTGKTSAAKAVASALGLDFLMTGALESKYDVFGFLRPDGVMAPSLFRQAWEHGGVFLFDEIDGSSPQALVALNAALANGTCAFPDRMVSRHPDCVILAAANTFGHGGDAQTAGRVRQDGPLLNRFVFLEWPLDEALEEACCGDPDWLRIVRALRSRAQQNAIRATITPRASIYGAALRAAGVSARKAAESLCRNGLNADSWQRLTDGVPGL